MFAKRALVGLIVTLTLVSLLPGCSGPSQAPAAQAQPTQAQSAAQPAAKALTGGTISVWVQANDAAGEGWRGRNIEQAAELLKKEKNVDVKVEDTIDGSAWADYKKKALLAFDAGSAPDIILSGHEDIAPWAQAGYVIALDDSIKGRQDVYKDVFPVLWGATEWQGKRWAVPQDTEARPLYYSKILLKKLGWSDADINGLPDKIKTGQWTMDDMLATAKQAVDKGVVQKGNGWWHRTSAGYDWFIWYFIYGGELQDAASGKLVMTRDAWLKYYQLWDKVIKDGITRQDIIGMQGKIFDEGVAPGETVLFWTGGTWKWADWGKNIVKDKGGQDYLFQNVGYALVPAATKGGKPATLSHPLIYMISKQSKNPQLAFELITRATSPELNTKHAVDSSHLAILTTQVNYPDYAKDKFLKDAAYMSEYTRFIPNHPKFGAYETAQFNAVKAVEAGELTPDAAVKQLENQLKADLGTEIIFK